MTSTELLAPPPSRIVLAAERDVTVAHMGMGVTLYLDDPYAWASGAAADLLSSFVERLDPRLLRWFTTSLLPGWQRLSPADIPHLVDSLRVGGFERRMRHLLEVRMADDPGAPMVGFAYREIDPGSERRTGYVQIAYPIDHDPNELLQLVIEIGHRFPIWCGIGGYLATWNERVLATAFTRIHAWCHRYLGLDVHYAEKMSWHVCRGLPSIGWLTLLGANARNQLGIDAEALRARPWTQPVAVFDLAQATLIRAGETPLLGDLNAMAYPLAHAEVARALAPHMISEPPSFPGMFEVKQDTGAWMQRFVRPEHWGAA